MGERDTSLDLDLRLGHMRRAQRQSQPRLSRNLRQLGAAGPYVPEPGHGSQQAVVHGWFGKTSTTYGHLIYMQKGKGRDEQDVPLFGPRDRPVDGQWFLQDAQQDPHQFRFSVSLKERPRFFDFQRFVEIFMQRVERDLGRPLDWLAAVHHDTAHPHAHVILRGRDRDGKPLYIAKDYLSHGMRYRASDIATALLGPEKSQGRETSSHREASPVQERASAMSLRQQIADLEAKIADAAYAGDSTRHYAAQRDALQQLLRQIEPEQQGLGQKRGRGMGW